MFLIGHIGISVGIIYVLAWVISSRFSKDNTGKLSPWGIDFRIVIIAAILPDIIDKIIGMIILKEEISNGRLFTHSIVIVSIFSILLLITTKIKINRGLQIPFYIIPVYLHLLLDRLWEDPHTLFWPIFRTSFPKLDMGISDYFTILLSEPYIFVGEVLGGLIIITLFMRHKLFINIKFFSFLKEGRLSMVGIKKGK
ncbi:MAG: metal-dependent hydrolase [Thermoplasmata archaeon]|nr:MAG: metal-dependent hydrolase [Thermoplasmata archaeon]